MGVTRKLDIGIPRTSLEDIKVDAVWAYVWVCMKSNLLACSIPASEPWSDDPANMPPHN